jgi:hypothetical protein
LLGKSISAGNLESKYSSQCADSDGAIVAVVIGVEDKL